MKYNSKILDEIRTRATPLVNHDAYHDALLACVGDAQIVLLGEAPHGTMD